MKYYTYFNIIVSKFNKIDLKIENNTIVLIFKGNNIIVINKIKKFFNFIEEYKILESNFNTSKEQIRKTINERSSRFMLNDILNSEINPNLYQLSELKLNDLKFSDLQVSNLKFKYTVIAIGDIKYEELENIFDLGPIFAKVTTDQKFCMIDIFDQLKNIKKNNLNNVEYKRKDSNINITGIYYRLPNSEDGNAIGLLISIIAKNILYSELRQKEMIGYYIKCEIEHIILEDYLVFKVQSRISIRTLKIRMLKFIKDLENIILKMPNKEFEEYKNSLIKYYEESSINIDELSNVIFNRIHLGFIDLNFNIRCINTVKKIKQKNLMIFKESIIVSVY